jgi:hypothetical protein
LERYYLVVTVKIPFKKNSAKEKEVAMRKLRIRACSRCKNGEVFLDRDEYGWYECCLQCGYSRDLPSLAQPVANESREKEKVGLPSRRGRSLTISRGV